jgi:hypothetical protein
MLELSDDDAVRLEFRPLLGGNMALGASDDNEERNDEGRAKLELNALDAGSARMQQNSSCAKQNQSKS